MSERDVELYLDDVLDAIDAIREYTADMDFDAFRRSRKTLSATLREFIVIGEAIGKLMMVQAAPRGGGQGRVREAGL